MLHALQQHVQVEFPSIIFGVLDKVGVARLIRL
jgi:hypothetical protein